MAMNIFTYVFYFSICYIPLFLPRFLIFIYYALPRCFHVTVTVQVRMLTTAGRFLIFAKLGSQKGTVECIWTRFVSSCILRMRRWFAYARMVAVSAIEVYVHLCVCLFVFLCTCFSSCQCVREWTTSQ